MGVCAFAPHKAEPCCFAKLDAGFIIIIIATADVALNSFQFEAQGPLHQPNMSLAKSKIRLVLQGQHMKQGVNYEHSYSPVPQASGFCTMLALATAEDMLINHVDINQVFLQGDMLKEEGLKATSTSHLLQAMVRMQNMSIALCAPLYGACTSSRAWHKTMSAFTKRQGFKTVSFVP